MPVSQLFKATQSPKNLTGFKISKYHHRVQIYATEYEPQINQVLSAFWVHRGLKVLLAWYFRIPAGMGDPME